MDPAESIASPDILVIEGLHPFYDQRVRDLVDFKIYLVRFFSCGCLVSLW